MKKKLLTLTFLLTSSVVLLPVGTIAATGSDPSAAAKTSPPQIRVQIGRNRGRHRGWWRGQRRGFNEGRRIGRNDNSRLVQQVYWVNGRRYVRWIRRY